MDFDWQTSRIHTGLLNWQGLCQQEKNSRTTSSGTSRASCSSELRGRGVSEMWELSPGVGLLWSWLLTFLPSCLAFLEILPSALLAIESLDASCCFKSVERQNFLTLEQTEYCSTFGNSSFTGQEEGELGMHSEEGKFFTASSGWGLWEHHIRLASWWLGVGPRPRPHLRQVMTCLSLTFPDTALPLKGGCAWASFYVFSSANGPPSHQNGTTVRDGNMIRLAFLFVCLFGFALDFWTPLIFLLIKFIILIIP